jgi:hypothetical protein
MKRLMDLETISGYDSMKKYPNSAKTHLGKIIGYHNYYRFGVIDAARRVQENCPAGYIATWGDEYEKAPRGALRVGQVSCSGFTYILFVIKR